MEQFFLSFHGHRPTPDTLPLSMNAAWNPALRAVVLSGPYQPDGMPFTDWRGTMVQALTGLRADPPWDLSARHVPACSVCGNEELHFSSVSLLLMRMPEGWTARLARIDAGSARCANGACNGRAHIRTLSAHDTLSKPANRAAAKGLS